MLAYDGPEIVSIVQLFPSNEKKKKIKKNQ